MERRTLEAEEERRVGGREVKFLAASEACKAKLYILVRCML